MRAQTCEVVINREIKEGVPWKIPIVGSLSPACMHDFCKGSPNPPIRIVSIALNSLPCRQKV